MNVGLLSLALLIVDSPKVGTVDYQLTADEGKVKVEAKGLWARALKATTTPGGPIVLVGTKEDFAILRVDSTGKIPGVEMGAVRITLHGDGSAVLEGTEKEPAVARINPMDGRQRKVVQARRIERKADGTYVAHAK